MAKKRKIPKTNLEKLSVKREETIQRWSKLGLLEGLEKSKNVFDFMEVDEKQIINEDPSQIVDD